MRTEQEIKTYLEAELPSFKEHKKIIIKAYGLERYEKAMKQRVDDIRQMWDKAKTEIPGIGVEQIVIIFNDNVMSLTHAQGGDDLDMLHNMQINVIAGMILRGYDV
jgi:hypothetical protein